MHPKSERKAVAHGNVPALKDNYLDWEGVLSDHTAQTLSISHDLQILTWNIMTQGRSSKDRGTNNGFNYHETAEEYHRRLKRLGRELALHIKHNAQLAIMTLQEAPITTSNLRLIYLAMESELAHDNADPLWQSQPIFRPSLDNPSFGMLTIINQQHISDVKQVELDNLPYQTGRVLITDLCYESKLDGPQRLRVVNSHFKARHATGKMITPQEAQADIEALLASSQEQVVIAGDFNQNLCDLINGKNLIYSDPGAISYCYIREQGQIQYNVDGFILRQNLLKG